MKRNTVLPVCLFLIIALLLGGLVYYTSRKPVVAEYYDPAKDLSAVQESDAAYLLDPDFTVTAENFSDCIHDYFAAPSILYYKFFWAPDYVDRLIKDKRSVEFADAFSNLSLSPISKEELSGMETDFTFQNAIGFLTLYEYGGALYIEFYRNNDLVQDRVCFYAQELESITQIIQISKSLEDVSEEIPEYEVPH